MGHTHPATEGSEDDSVPGSGSTEGGRPDPVLRCWISDRDETRWVTVGSLAGLAAGVAMVLLGGLPVDMPMPTHAVGWVGPTCGLTRGSTALLRGDASLAWSYNPASFLVVAAALFWLARSAVGLATGLATSRWLNVRLRPNLVVGVAVLVVAILLGIWQQSNLEFVMSSRR